MFIIFLKVIFFVYGFGYFYNENVDRLIFYVIIISLRISVNEYFSFEVLIFYNWVWYGEYYEDWRGVWVLYSEVCIGGIVF